MLTSNLDFGYPWWLTWGHLIPFALFGLLALTGWRLGWSRWLVATSAIACVWGLAGYLILQQLLLVERPLPLPTEFLPSATGRVLDMGAGSGRATLGVLQERPRATVVALDLYQGYYGIEDNTPERLKRNAAALGVADRVDVRVGDMRAIPFPDASFDGAVSSYAIDHLRRDDIPRALREATRVLRPDGQILIMNIGVDIWTRVALPSLHGHSYFSQEQDTERWRGWLTEAGFARVDVGRLPATKYFLGRKKG